MPNDAERLLNLAEAVADGRDLDWNAVESATTDDEDRELIKQLHLLAGVAEANRSVSEADDPWRVLDTVVEAPWRWGTLEIREKLGAGAFGTVYRAWDPRLARDVALKLRPSPQLDGEPEPSVLREGQLLARVRHPHVITVYGADRFGDQVGTWMELIRGRTLEQVLREQGPFSAREAAAIGIDLCSALAAVHGANLLHRDIKAQNVMREEGGRIVLMDFGAGQDAAAIQYPPRMVGTPAYMAPELFDEGPATPQTDVYSLGVLLFRLVTGEYPVMAVDADGMRAAHERGSRRGLIDLRPDLPTRFAEVIERALRKDPHERYETAGAMRLALSQGLDALSAPVQPPPRGPALGRRTVLWALALALLAVFAIAGLPGPRRAVGNWLGLAPVTNLAVLPFSNVSADRASDYFADGVTEILMSRLGMVGSLRVMARSSINALPAGERDPKSVFRRLGAAFVVEGSVERRDDRVRVVSRLIEASTGTIRWTQTFERPLGDLFSLEGEMASAIGAAIGARLSGSTRSRLLAGQTSSIEGQDAYLQGRYLIYTFNRARFKEARVLLERAVSLDPNYAVAHASLSRTYGLMLDGDMAPSRDLIPLAIASAARGLATGPDLAETNVAFAESKYRYEHDWDAADAAYRRAIELAPNSSLVRSPYARFLCAADRLDEALAQAGAGGLADPISAEMTATVGITHYYRREYGEALRFYEQAASLSPGYGPVYFGMARVYSAQNNYAKAIEYVRKAMTLVGENPTYRAELARNYALGGWRSSAEQVLGGLLRDAENGTAGVNYEGIGYAFAALGDIDRAFEWLDRSLDHYFARLLYIKVDPRADPLRHDPRFAVLLARLGLT